MTIIVTSQLRVTVDRIHNNCNVELAQDALFQLLPARSHRMPQCTMSDIITSKYHILRLFDEFDTCAL